MSIDLIKSSFRQFLENHPKMKKDKPGPKDMYINLLDSEGALNVNIKALQIPGFTTSYECRNPFIWANVIKPIYEFVYQKRRQ